MSYLKATEIVACGDTGIMEGQLLTKAEAKRLKVDTKKFVEVNIKKSQTEIYYGVRREKRR